MQYLKLYYRYTAKIAVKYQNFNFQGGFFMNKKGINLQCEELEAVKSATDWTEGAYTGFGVGLAVVAVAAGGVALFAFT